MSLLLGAIAYKSYKENKKTRKMLEKQYKENNVSDEIKRMRELSKMSAMAKGR